MTLLNHLDLGITVAQLPTSSRLLIVDDEVRFRSAYRTLLAGPERQIEECATGQDALRRLAQRDIDVVVLDLHLPDIGGLEIMDWLTRNHIQTSIVVFSADDGIDSAIHALRQGAFEFIRKHSDPADLLGAVDRALKRRRMEREHALMTARLEQSERLHRFLVDQSPDFIYTLDSEGRFIFVNSRIETLLGYARDELLGQHYSCIVHEDDLEKARYAFHERRIGERATTNFEVRLKTKTAGIRHFDNRMIVAILSSQGVYNPNQDISPSSFLGTSGVARDITERKQAEETIAFQAFHDLLTGLPNRTLFKDRLELALTQAHRKNQRVGVMFLDLDRFKLINDTYGHAEGDHLLKEFAQRIRGCLRSGDTLARQGGDEFTVLLPDISSRDDVLTIAGKMLAELKQPFLIAGRDFYTTVSIGIAVFPEDGENPELLLRNADIAMYQTKAHGKNGFREFTPDINTHHVERISLENDLRYALKEGSQFELHLQPQISRRRRRIVGIEALIRWHHPTQGLLGPDAFIPLAEECGLISGISNWVIAEACRQMRHLRALGYDDLKIGINLSPRDFERADLLERITEQLTLNNVPARCLELEITESLLMNDAEGVLAKVRQLRRAGLLISIDDFGTGFSSLNYLRRFSVSSLKIDQSFVRDLGGGSAGGLIHAILGIARSFELGTIAEGIETPAQAEALSTLGCDLMQGYLFSPPLTMTALIDYLASPPAIA
ncbi:MAG: EAL domain-containing protein [Dechloromonas sp.]|nr:MAG: EAL domain-containing protein [Dechloromonas sp.]